MKLHRLGFVGVSLASLLLGCSDSETVLSVNLNLSNDKLNRRATNWTSIDVTITGSSTITKSIKLETSEQEVVKLLADGMAETDAMGNPLKEKAQALKAKWFERIDLGTGWSGTAKVTATATGAYFQTVKVQDKDVPKSVSTMFLSGDAMDDMTDPDNEKRTIKVELTPTPIEENGVSTVFLSFLPPEPEPAPPMGGSGGTGGMAAATGGEKSTAGAGAGGGGASSGGSTGAATGGATATGGSGGTPAGGAATSGGDGAGGASAGGAPSGGAADDGGKGGAGAGGAAAGSKSS